MSDALQQLRERIDVLDNEILDRLIERAHCAKRVGEIKQGNLYRPEREAQVLRRIAEQNPGPLPDAHVQRIFREIMSACLALEQPLKVAYLGPAGTYSEAAARKHFGNAPAFSPLATIDDVFRAVETERVDYGIVPVENSTEGAVGLTLDLLLDSPARICGEVKLPIHHQLLSRASTTAALTHLYSHAQSIAQCHEWLNRNLPDVRRVAVSSNAEAARLAAEDNTACAIAGETAQALYGLNRLAENIEDDPNNTTRFLVISRHDASASGIDRTSLVCSSRNQPGAMYELLEPLARHEVGMSKLQSRPAAGGKWEYVFYIDLDGHVEEKRISDALQELRERACFVKVLGSYPKAAI